MPRRESLTITALAVCATLMVVGAAPASAESSIVVESGQTLYGIAKRYGCSVKAIQRANSLRDSMIYAGQTLKVPDCDEPSGKGSKSKKVRKQPDPADYGLSAKGGRVKAKKGQSIGLPWDGSLKNASELPKGKGYFIRRPYRAYGAAHVVTHIQRAIKAVRKRFPKVHTLAIGDISAKKGGSISDHHSHQSGRDVDIGFYFKKKPKGYPDSFLAHDSAKLDLAATWALLYAFARTADDDNGVQAIFLDYGVQKRLYEWAKDHSVPKDYLDKIFQYPDRDGSGLVRHEPNHDDHFHIRFKCPSKDSGCER